MWQSDRGREAGQEIEGDMEGERGNQRVGGEGIREEVSKREWENQRGQGEGMREEVRK